MAVAGGIEIPVTLGGVKELRQEIKNLRGELINATDPKEVARLSENIGELSDKLKDANEKASVFASGSKFEQASNAFSLMKGQIASLDFEGAGESASLFANRIKAINPAEFGTQIKGLISIVGNLGKAFVTMGLSLMANPIFLIATAIAGIVAIIGVLLNKLGVLKPILNAIGSIFRAIGDAIGWVVQQVKDFLDWLGLTNFAEQEAANKSAEAQEKRADAYEKASKNRISAIDQAIRMEQLDGKNTVDMEIRKQELIRQTARERVKALQARYQAMITSGDYDKEEIKKLKEDLATQREAIKSSTNEIAYILKKDRVDKEKADTEAKNKAVETAKAEAKERADAYRKYKEDRQAIEREIQDLIIQGMKDGEEKERAEINAKYQRAIEDVKANEKYLKDERVRVIELLRQEQSNQLNAIDEAKHREEVERKQEQEKELRDIELQSRNQLIEEIEELENAYQESQLPKEEQELNAIREKYFTQLELARQYGIDTAILEEAQLSELNAIRQKYADEEAERQKTTRQKNIDAVKGSFQAIGSIAEAWAGKDKERQKKAFKVQKAMNIATATIDTYKGAVSAFASAGNPIMGAVFAALTVAAGLANIVKIKNTQFEDGGGGSTPSVGATASASSTAVQPAFSFQGSGNNANNLSSQNGFSNITVKAVVSESEVTETQNKVSKYKDNATL